MSPRTDHPTDWQPDMPIFADRVEAGRQLGEELKLRGYGEMPTVVVAIPRGGVPVGHAVARAVGATLEIIIPRRLTIPDEPQLTFGAITPDGTMVLDLPLVESRRLTTLDIKRVAMETLAEVRRQRRAYRGQDTPLELIGKTVILVDDGLSSGFTMLAAVRAIHRHQPSRVVVAVPVSSLGSLDRLLTQVNELVCLVERDNENFAVAHCYRDFSDLTDDQVRAFLTDPNLDGQP